MSSPAAGSVIIRPFLASTHPLPSYSNLTQIAQRRKLWHQRQGCPPGLPTCAYPFFAWEARLATRQLENVKIFLGIIWNSEIKIPPYLVAILKLDYLIAIWISWFLTKISEAHGTAICKSFVVIFIIAAFTFFWYINYQSIHPSRAFDQHCTAVQCTGLLFDVGHPWSSFSLLYVAWQK